MEMSRTAVGVLAGLCLVGGAAGAHFFSRSGVPLEAESGPATVAAVTPEPAELEPAPLVASSQATTTTRPAPASTARNESRRSAVSGRERTAPAPTPTAVAAPVLEGEIASTPAVTSVPIIEASPVAPPPPTEPLFEELVIPAESVVGLQVETAVTSEDAQVEDRVVARVTRDIRVGDRVAVPVGSTANGTVTVVERGGRLKERARLGVRFDSIELADGTRIPITTDAIYREGDSPTGESAAKIGGGAIGGAIIGGIFGGGKGAAIGSSIGAGAGTAAVMAGGRNPATLPAGSTLTVRLQRSTSVTVER